MLEYAFVLKSESAYSRFLQDLVDVREKAGGAAVPPRLLAQYEMAYNLLIGDFAELKSSLSKKEGVDPTAQLSFSVLLALSQGEVDRAARMVREYISKYGPHHDAKRYELEVLLLSQSPADQIRNLRTEVAKAPTYWGLRHLMAMKLLEHGDVKEALTTHNILMREMTCPPI